jgi:hypothetical protein
MRSKEVAGMAPRELSSDSGNASVKPEGQAGFEMANLRPDRTGLPFVVFMSQRGGAGHDVRVKVAHTPRVRPSEMVTVALRPPVRVIRGRLEPHDLDLLRRWIEINAQVIIDYWNGIIEYTEDALNALSRLGTESVGSPRAADPRRSSTPFSLRDAYAARRCVRIRDRISTAALGMLVPGP